MFYKLYALLLFPLLSCIKIKAKFSPNRNLSGIGFENENNTIRKLLEALAGCKVEIFLIVYFRETYLFQYTFSPQKYYTIINKGNEPKYTLSLKQIINIVTYKYN